MNKKKHENKIRRFKWDFLEFSMSFIDIAKFTYRNVSNWLETSTNIGNLFYQDITKISNIGYFESHQQDVSLWKITQKHTNIRHTPYTKCKTSTQSYHLFNKLLMPNSSYQRHFGYKQTSSGSKDLQNKTKQKRKEKKCHIARVCSVYRKTFVQWNVLLCRWYTAHTHSRTHSVDIWLDKNGWHVAHILSVV